MERGKSLDMALRFNAGAENQKLLNLGQRALFCFIFYVTRYYDMVVVLDA